MAMKNEGARWPHGAAYLLLGGRPSADWPLSSLLWRSALLTTGPRHWRDIWTSGHPVICNTYWPIGQIWAFLSQLWPASCLVHFIPPSWWSVQRSGPLHWCRKSLVPRSWSWAGLGLVWSLRTGAIPALGPPQFLHCQLLVPRLSDLWRWLL